MGRKKIIKSGIKDAAHEKKSNKELTIEQLLLKLRNDEETWQAISEAIDAEAYRVLSVLVTCDKEDSPKNQGYYNGLFWLVQTCNAIKKNSEESPDVHDSSDSYA